MKVSLMRGNTKIEIREERRRERKREYNPLKSRLVGYDNGLVHVSEKVVPDTIDKVKSLSESEQTVIRSNFLSGGSANYEDKQPKEFIQRQDKFMDSLGIKSDEVNNVEKPVNVDTEEMVDEYNDTMEESNPITITAEELQNAMLGGNVTSEEDNMTEQIMKTDLKEDLEEEKIEEDLNDKYTDEYEDAQGGLEKICKTNKKQKDLSLY